MSVQDFIYSNWALVLLLTSMFIMTVTTVHLTKRSVIRMFLIIVFLAVLSVASYIEVGLGNGSTWNEWRAILTAWKYFLPAILLALVGMIVMKSKALVNALICIPAAISTVLCLISIPTGIVFSSDRLENSFLRGPLGYLPFVVDGIYVAFLVFALFFQSSKLLEDILPLSFIALSSVSCIALPLIWLDGFEKWFCVTIAIIAFTYYVYMIQQLTKKDALTGLLNRQSYYSDLEKSDGDITAVVSLDMNGLKTTNDRYGHDAGDKALTTLSNCFKSAAKKGQRVYRVGGDEFMILCIRCDKKSVEALAERIRSNVEKTCYTCSLGYCFCEKGVPLEETIRISDERMYDEKKEYYRLLNDPDE